MPNPFDIRIKRLIEMNTDYNAQTGTSSSGSALLSQMPFSNGSQNDSADISTDTITNSYIQLPYEIDAAASQNDEDDEKIYKKTVEIHNQMLSSPNGLHRGTASIMNPYAYTRLFGAQGANCLVDRYNIRKYYEMDANSDTDHYARDPKTSNLIKWGSLDKYGRFPYEYQDFVFCKHWNIIPNNRMITLRRYTQPTYDNMNFPVMDGSITMHPVATAVTYFGEGTDNKLSDILGFTAGLPWEDQKGSIWTVSSSVPSMGQLDKATGHDKFFSSGMSNFASVLGLFGKHNEYGNENFDKDANKGLPPDPYQSGLYANRILGPVNQINTTKRRAKEGENNQSKELDFSMDNIKLKFHYVARPIAGINNKAVLLDIMANLLVMCYASAVFFGGAHRFQIEPTMYPFNDDEARQALWKGKVVGPNGAASILVNNFKDKIKQGTGGGGIGNIFATLGNAFRIELGSAFKMFNMDKIGDFITGNARSDQNAVNVTENLEDQIASTIQGRVGTLPYLDNMKATLTGNPVGDWHLTIGNPMNPIAMIGNLVCENISFTFDDELGPDDFPIGFTAEVTLKHGMKRDRDGIEAMFNRGAGRIYELPDKYASSADGQTNIDKYTGSKGSGAYRWTDVPKVPAKTTNSTKGQIGNANTLSDAYRTPSGELSISAADGMSVRDFFYTKDMSGITHKIMPWQTRIVL